MTSGPSSLGSSDENEDLSNRASTSRPDPRTDPLRSLLFLAMRSESALVDPGRFGADVLVLDLEDGVPPDEKEPTREKIVAALDAGAFDGHEAFVRLNGLDSLDDLRRDLHACAVESVAGFVLPMLETERDVQRFEQLVASIEEARSIRPGTFRFIPLLETPSAILNADAIARASGRNIALGFGHADLTNLTGSDDSEEALLGPRTAVVLAARASGLGAIETPYVQLSKPQGFERACRHAKALGFSGMWLVHPGQVDPANRILRPGPQEVRWARRVLSRSQGELARTSEHGRLIGKPMVTKARSIEAQASEEDAVAEAFDGVVGRSRRYGVDLDTIRVGQVIESPHQLTVDESWRTTWFSSFHTADLLSTSAVYAQRLGFSAMPLPANLVLNLDLCMSVEPFSESCLLHLGLHEVRYLRPACAGDTFRALIRVDSLRNTSNGKQSVIKTTHVLLNQRDEPVFSLVKMSLYPHIQGLDEREPMEPQRRLDLPRSDEVSPLRSALLDAGSAVAPPAVAHHSLEPGELLLHPRVRPIGESENLALTTLFRNTHPIHFDYQAHAPEEIIVCGGFVMSMAAAAGSRDLRQVLDEEIVHCSHVNPVVPTDSVGAISFVLDVQPVGDHLEEVTVKTLGLKNTDVSVELDEVNIPRALLEESSPKPSEVESICKSYCPILSRRIAMQMTRRLLRPAGSA